MRKVIVALIAVVSLGAGTAFAQSGYWAGASTGLPFGITLHFGMEEVFTPELDVRFSLQGRSYGGRVAGETFSFFVVTVGADALYNLDLDADPNLSVYVGGGLSLGLASGSTSPSNVSHGGAAYDIHALAGAEYLVAPNWGIFGEGQLGYGVVAGAAAAPGGTVVSATDSGATFALRLGVNYHF